VSGEDKAAWNNPPADLSRWSRFAELMARALARHRSIVSYEIYNEANVRQWWEGPAEYARLLESGAAAISQSVNETGFATVSSRTECEHVTWCGGRSQPS